MYVWTAIGELLGVLCDVDSVPSDESEVGVRLDDTPGQIEERLRLEKARLSTEGRLSGVPDAVIAAIVPAIEALSKRIWPNELSEDDSQRVSLLTVWSKCIENRKPPLKYRFSAIARNLYLTYRNQATHGMESVRYSYEEAGLVVAGIVTLLDLSKRIARED